MKTELIQHIQSQEGRLGGYHWLDMDWMWGKEKRWKEGELLLDFAGKLHTKSIAASEEEEQDQGTAEVKEHIHYLQI